MLVLTKNGMQSGVDIRDQRLTSDVCLQWLHQDFSHLHCHEWRSSSFLLCVIPAYTSKMRQLYKTSTIFVIGARNNSVKKGVAKNFLRQPIRR